MYHPWIWRKHEYNQIIHINKPLIGLQNISQLKVPKDLRLDPHKWLGNSWHHIRCGFVSQFCGSCGYTLMLFVEFKCFHMCCPFLLHRVCCICGSWIRWRNQIRRWDWFLHHWSCCYSKKTLRSQEPILRSGYPFVSAVVAVLVGWEEGRCDFLRV